MKQHAALAFATILTVSPVSAQSPNDGPDLMERGMELFFEGLREEMSPALQNMRRLVDDYGPALFSFLEEMGPAFGDMLDQVKDWSAYHPPEILPNGDIILRKKQLQQPTPDAPSTPGQKPPTEPAPPGQIDL